jgi:arylsulfatase A-like enzyme
MTRRDFLAAAGAAGLLPETEPAQSALPMTDQMRFDAMSCAGNRLLPTPNLDRLARESIRFENDVCPFPVCVPSRTGMLTGLSTDNTKVEHNLATNDPVLNPGPTFDNILHDQGYKSQYYGKWHAPHKMAGTYDNRVNDVANEHRAFLAFLDEHAPKKQPHKGELLDSSTSACTSPIQSIVSTPMRRQESTLPRTSTKISSTRLASSTCRGNPPKPRTRWKSRSGLWSR